MIRVESTPEEQSSKKNLKNLNSYRGKNWKNWCDSLFDVFPYELCSFRDPPWNKMLRKACTLVDEHTAWHLAFGICVPMYLVGCSFRTAPGFEN